MLNFGAKWQLQKDSLALSFWRTNSQTWHLYWLVKKFRNKKKTKKWAFLCFSVEYLYNLVISLCACVLCCAVVCVMLECLSFQSGVSMELCCLGQTSGSQGREPWVNFKLLPPSRRERPSQCAQQIGCRSTIMLHWTWGNITELTNGVRKLGNYTYGIFLKFCCSMWGLGKR